MKTSLSSLTHPTDLSKVVRPRARPLLHEYTADDGKIHNVWTTFSKDQVDLNYKSYKVLRSAVLDAMFYLHRKRCNAYKT